MATAIFIIGFLAVAIIVPVLLAFDRSPERAWPGEAATGGLFTSRRERRLWAWTLAVLAAIYATMGLVGQVASVLRERDLLELASTVVLVLAGGVVAIRWARTHPGWHELGVGLGVAAVFANALSRASIPERTHLFEYGLVAILIHQALGERRRNGRRVPLPPVWAVVATVLLAWLDEGLQSLLPSRVYDVADVGVSAVAAVGAVTASVSMAWVRRWGARRLRSRSGR